MCITLLFRVLTIDTILDDKICFLNLSLRLFVERTPTIKSFVEVVFIISENIVQPVLSKPNRLFIFHAPFQERIVHDLFENLLDLLLSLWCEL